ncbi:Ig-like domain-containing protein [Candidatus Accumulibacter sp. ACC005]|uniref:Ig-like domain-containing protein n=1 Tax=Candidatus Accumulibacter sp. ACC005 TaxID=2823331 RepID=UPI0025C5EB79|nr:Ig-like domain-containing protein [Candidatus Accumulibacter sp. ACC005]
MADGSHSVRLLAEDAAGNASAPTDVAFTLDRSAPLLSLELDPAFDTGQPGDRQTTATPVDLLASSEAGTRVELLDSLGQTLADTVADAAGKVRFAGLALLLGENAFSARATDRAGNSRLADLTLTRTGADTSGPLVTLQLANDSGASANDGVTNDAAISGTVSDESAIASLRAGFGSDPAGFTSILDSLQSDGSFALDSARLATLNGGALPDGAYTLRVIAGDSVGNPSPISELAFTLDSVAPAAPVIDLTDASDSGSSDSDNLTNDTTPTLSLTGAGGSILRLFQDGTPLASLAGPGGDVTVNPLADGEHTFSATAEDLAGNLSAAGALQITIDTVPPKAPLLDLATASDSGASATDGITNDTMPRLIITAEPDSELSLFRDGALVAEGLLGPVAAFTSDPLIDGRYHFTASASDAAGNVGSAGELQITVDTVAPAVNVQLANDSGVSAEDRITSDPTIAGFVDETGLLASLRAGFGNDPAGFTSIINALQADGRFTLDAARLATINGGALPDGEHTLRLLASDLAGNTSTIGELAFTLDTAAPVLASIGLDPASDTGALGDLETSASVATLLGLSEAGIGVNLGGQRTTADANGAFSFVDQPLALGENAFTIILHDAAGNSAQSTLSVIRVEPPIDDHTAPTLAAGLLMDSGRSNSDGITSDPTIAGVATDDTAVTVLRVGFGTDPATFVDVLDSVQVDGSFTLDAPRLALINGGALPDGSYTLRLRAEDAVGNIATSGVTFALDTQAPTAPGFWLSLASDTGVVGDGDTEAARVTLVGSAEANTDLLLLETGANGVASNSGSFFLPDVALALGDNTLTLRSIDAAGNAAQTSLLVHRRATQSSGDAVLQWNDIALAAIQLDASTPPVATRGLAMLSIAVLDTVSAFEGTPGYYVSRSAPAGASLEAAIAAAAERLLSYLYPAQQTNFAAAFAAALAGIPDGVAKTDAVALGRSIADDVITLRRGDGFDNFVDFNGGTLPGQWQATAPMYAVALLPQWATLQPFAMSSPSAFRPAPPPALDSATYTADFAEVKALGSATNNTRSAEQTESALFWADGAGTATPPGHWNRIAATLATASGNSLAANARLFAQLNVALADATITAWDAKYHYSAWRPITAIRAADVDGNDATTAEAQWTPLLINPPFPEYVSGHSTYSGAADAILTSAFGQNAAFTIGSDGLPGVQRSYANIHDAAEEAGRSRIYGGIHFEYGNQAGLAAGRALGQQVLDVFGAGADTQAPRLLLDQAEGLVTASNIEISGRVLDALSGVVTLEGALDADSPVSIVFDGEGRFTVGTAFALDGSTDGLHTLTLTATDARGNRSAPLTLDFTLDTRAPAIGVTSIADGDALSAASRLAGSADPTGSPLIRLTYAFDGGQPMPVPFDAATGQFDTAFELAKLATGAHALTLEASDAAGNRAVSTLNLTLPELIPLTITRVTPSSGADDVGATFRPQVFFSRPVDVTTLNSSNFYATDTTGARLAATIVPAADGSFAWLFLQNPMPGASTISVHVVGDTIRAANGGQALDADGDGTAGGSFVYRFTTVSVTPIAGTTITGRLLDPGDDLKPMTFDDIRSGADGVLHTADDVFLNPIAGAKVYILGLEGNVVYTDADGFFHLDQVPAGNVKLAIDGRTASNAPSGAFYPEMVLDLTIEVGYDNTVMGSMGTRETMAANEERQEVYLPRLQTSILQTVSDSTTTEVGVDAASAPNLTAEQRAQLKLEVQPGTLIDADGNVMSAGQVGISTVPPELVRDMLPSGVLQHTFDITIQAPGVAAFATPLEITFPNVFNAAPGTKLNFLSFDHTTGRLVIEGTATVSADGKSVTTDPGQGITKPGWHGVTPLGTQNHTDPRDDDGEGVTDRDGKDNDGWDDDGIDDDGIDDDGIDDDGIDDDGIDDDGIDDDGIDDDGIDDDGLDDDGLDDDGLDDDGLDDDGLDDDGLDDYTGLPDADGFDNDGLDDDGLDDDGLDDDGLDDDGLDDDGLDDDGLDDDGLDDDGLDDDGLDDDGLDDDGLDDDGLDDDGLDDDGLDDDYYDDSDDEPDLYEAGLTIGGSWIPLELSAKVNFASFSFYGLPSAWHWEFTVPAKPFPFDTTIRTFRFLIPEWSHWKPYIDMDVATFDAKLGAIAYGHVGGQIKIKGLDPSRTGTVKAQFKGDAFLGAQIKITKGWLTSLPFGVGNFLGQPLDIRSPYATHIDLKTPEVRLPLSKPSQTDVTLSIGLLFDALGGTHSKEVGIHFVVRPVRTERVRSINGSTSLAELAHDFSSVISKQKDYTMANSASAASIDTLPDEDLVYFSNSRGISTDARVYYRYLLENGSELAGISDAKGKISVFLPEFQKYNLYLYRASENRTAVVSGTTGMSGSVHEQQVLLSMRGGPDADRDSIPDLGEFVIGSDSYCSDTDNDGLSDAAEIAQGSDPLGGRPFANGTIATMQLAGPIKEIILEGAVQSVASQTAFVATGGHGLAIVNASSFQNPVILSQLDLPGDAVDVSVDSRLGIAAVATTTGLQMVDVSDRLAPKLTGTINVPAAQVEVIDGIAYVAAINGLESYSLQTGELLQVLTLSSSDITGLAREGRTLYALDATSVLRAVDIAGLGMQARGSLALPAGSGKLFVGNGIAYVGAGNNIQGGFVTVDVSNPDALALLSGVDAANVQGHAIAANGSGLAVAVGTLRGPRGEAIYGIDVLDVRDPGRTDQFLTGFTLPAAPSSVAIGAGIAFVADGIGGLQVINYLPFDNKGVAPTATLAITTADADPNTPGFQAQEGSLLSLMATLNDDQQVRNAELLVDGTVIFNDVSFPWDMSAALPTIAAGTSVVTLQARATDTGGNTVLSDPLVVELVADTFPPRIIASNVDDGTRHGLNFRTVRLLFSEALDPTTVNVDNLRLLDAADQAIVPIDAGLSANGRSVIVTMPTLGLGDYRMVIDGDKVADRAGNTFGTAGQIVSSFQVVEATIEWTNPAGGDWNDPSNWEGGRLPTATDVVLITADPNSTITLNNGSVHIETLTTFNPLVINGGTLRIGDTLLAHELITLAGGTITGGTISADAGAGLEVMTAGRGQLSGVTLKTDVTVNDRALLTVQNGLTLADGHKVNLNGTSGHTVLSFEGDSQTLGGDGEIVFAGPFIDVVSANLNASQALTIGSGVTVHTSAAGGQYSFIEANSTVINQGTIAADAAGSRVNVTGNGLTNNGTLAVSNGGTLNLAGTHSTDQFGTLRNDGGTIVLSGTLENTGAILDLNAVTGVLTLAGGTITGGTISANAGAGLEVMTAGRGQLSGVTLKTDVTVNDRALLTVQNGLTLADGHKVNLNGTSGHTVLSFEGDSQTLGGDGEIVFAGPFIDVVSANLNASQTLTIGSGVTVHTSAAGGQYSFIEANSTVINQGTIAADAAGSRVNVTGNGLTNNGTLAVSNGGTLNLAGTHSTDQFGTLRNDGGTIVLSGTLENTGAILDLNAVTGVLTLAGGTITGGTISANAGAGLEVMTAGRGQLSGVTLKTDVTVNDRALLTVQNGLTLADGHKVNLNGTSGHTVLSFEGDSQTLGGDGEIVFAGPFIDVVSANLNASQALTISSGITVHSGAGGYNGTIEANSAIINEGTISADAAGKSISITGAGVTNSGRIEAAAGTISVSAASFRNDGIFSVLSGATATVSTIVNSGTIDVQAGSLFNVTNSFINNINGSVQIGIAGSETSAFGRLSVSGELYLDGTIKLWLAGNYVPPLGEAFRVMTYGSRIGNFSVLQDLDAGDGVTYHAVYNPTDLSLLVVPG